MKKLFLLIFAGALLANSNHISGQESEKSSTTLSVDIASGFNWRGLTLNSAPVVQPSFTIAPGKFSIGAWTSVPFTPDEYQEVDLFVSYQFTPSLSLTLTDYFGYSNGSWWSPPSFFETKREETAHALDLQLAYDGSGGFPVKAMVSTIIAGADLKYEGNFVQTSKNNFSTYIELGYGNTSKGIDWEIFAGGVLMSSDFYGTTDANIINLGLGLSKSFEITPTYSLPLSLKFSVNPVVEAVFLSAAITLF